MRAGYENWNNNRDVDPEVLADIGYAATHEHLHEVVASTLKRQAAGHEFVMPTKPGRETPPDIPEGTVLGTWKNDN